MQRGRVAESREDRAATATLRVPAGGCQVKFLHFTQHGSRKSGDALDLFVDETGLLRELFAKWKTTAPEVATRRDVVPAKWDHGTVGKLILEHAAVRLAAGVEVARVLQEGGGDPSDLQRMNQSMRPILDQMFDCSRGVQPVSLAITPGFVQGVERLQELLGPDLEDASERRARSELAAALGPSRTHLRNARFIRKHAPAHPGPEERWYDRISFLLRLHAAGDRLRGFPWGESHLGDRKLAERYDHEV